VLAWGGSPLLPARNAAAGAAADGAARQPAVPRDFGGALVQGLPGQAGAGILDCRASPDVHGWAVPGLGIGAGAAAQVASRFVPSVQYRPHCKAYSGP